MSDAALRLLLTRALPGLVFALSFRALPFAVAAAFCTELRPMARVAIAALYAALPLSLLAHDSAALPALGWLLAAWGYLLAGALSIHALASSPTPGQRPS